MFRACDHNSVRTELCWFGRFCCFTSTIYFRTSHSILNNLYRCVQFMCLFQRHSPSLCFNVIPRRYPLNSMAMVYIRVYFCLLSGKFKWGGDLQLIEICPSRERLRTGISAHGKGPGQRQQSASFVQLPS